MKALSLGFNLNIRKIQLELFNFSVCLWVEEDLLYAGLGSILCIRYGKMEMEESTIGKWSEMGS
jgi:hypothetical protein